MVFSNSTHSPLTLQLPTKKLSPMNPYQEAHSSESMDFPTDHFILESRLSCCLCRFKTPRRFIYNFKNTDIDALRRHLLFLMTLLQLPTSTRRGRIGVRRSWISSETMLLKPMCGTSHLLLGLTVRYAIFKIKKKHRDVELLGRTSHLTR